MFTPPTGRFILCVDDEKLVLDSLQRMLVRHFGKQFDLEFAESAEEALEILEELDLGPEPPVVIITDWLMPRMRGDEFLARVKTKYPDVKTIMLSGQADREAVRTALDKAWLDHFIAKPWEEDDLIRKILH